MFACFHYYVSFMNRELIVLGFRVFEGLVEAFCRLPQHSLLTRRLYFLCFVSGLALGLSVAILASSLPYVVITAVPLVVVVWLP